MCVCVCSLMLFVQLLLLLLLLQWKYWWFLISVNCENIYSHLCAFCTFISSTPLHRRRLQATVAFQLIYEPMNRWSTHATSSHHYPPSIHAISLPLCSLIFVVFVVSVCVLCSCKCDLNSHRSHRHFYAWECVQKPTFMYLAQPTHPYHTKHF